MANLTDFITEDFASVFLMGFAAGFILMATVENAVESAVTTGLVVL